MKDYDVSVELTQRPMLADKSLDIDTLILDITEDIDILSPDADKVDYLISAASGILCGLMDILWVGEFDLKKARKNSSDQVDSFVVKIAKMNGWKSKEVNKSNELQSAVQFLEKKFQMVGDKVTDKFGGALQHHLWEFSHHASPIGLLFSMITQFTGFVCGTDKNGEFIKVKVPEDASWMIGKTIPEKLSFGLIKWFLHLVSDMAGSKTTAGLSGGTGIPGPILSLAKSISALPVFHKKSGSDGNHISIIAKLFDGTIFAEHNENGRIIKDSQIPFDLRGELGYFFNSEEHERQSLPVIANEVFVRTFYLIRHLFAEIREKEITSLKDLHKIEFDRIKPINNPTIDRMLLVSSTVFSTIDIGAELAKNMKSGSIPTTLIITLKNVNKPGLLRVGFSIKTEGDYALKRHNLKRIKKAFEKEKQKQESEAQTVYVDRIPKFDLTLEETEILFNLDAYKVLYDIECQGISNPDVTQLKKEWLEEWKSHITAGFPKIVNNKNAVLHWYSMNEIIHMIQEKNPNNTWFSIVLMEAVMFTPYYPLTFAAKINGELTPSKKYSVLQKKYKPENGYSFIEKLFSGKSYYQKGFTTQLYLGYGTIQNELRSNTAVNQSKALLISPLSFLSRSIISIALNDSALAYAGIGLPPIICILRNSDDDNKLLSYGINTWLSESLFSIHGNTIDEVVTLSAKLLVLVDEVLLKKENDLVSAETILGQYSKTVRRFRIKVSKLEAEILNASKAEKKEKQIEKKKFERLLRIVENGSAHLRKSISYYKKFTSKLS